MIYPLSIFWGCLRVVLCCFVGVALLFFARCCFSGGLSIALLDRSSAFPEARCSPRVKGGCARRASLVDVVMIGGLCSRLCEAVLGRERAFCLARLAPHTAEHGSFVR